MLIWQAHFTDDKKYYRILSLRPRSKQSGVVIPA